MIDPSELRSDGGLLYHYTSGPTALEQILRPPMKLRLGRLAASNDPAETRLFNLLKGPPEDLSPAFLSSLTKQLRAAQHDVRVACFCTDAPGANAHWHSGLFASSSSGWARDRMWAQYADDHRGVCLAFHQPKLIASFQSELGARGECRSELVKYEDDQRGFPKPDFGEARSEGISAYVHRFMRSTALSGYFTKRLDWRGEDEFRLVLLPGEISAEEAFVPISDSLAWLTVGARFPDAYLPVVQEVCTRANIRAYKLGYTNVVTVSPYCSPRRP